MRRGLGFVSAAAGVVVPPVDPFTIAIDIAAVVIPALVALFRGKQHLDANQIVPEQNRYHQEVLAPAVAAKDNPSTPIEDLIYWDQQLRIQGEAFYQWAQEHQQYGSAAAEGAVRTIFGERDASGEWITTSAAPGYATQILRDLERIIGERTGMHAQLGIDWGRLAQIGVQIAANATGGPVTVQTSRGGVTAIPPTNIPGPYYNPYPGVVGAIETIPGWVWGAGAVAAIGGLVWLASSGGSRRR